MTDRPSSSSIHPDPPGHLLEGRYLCEQGIAKGESAEIFRGTDTWSGEQIAIRLLRDDRREKEDEFRRMAERLFGATSARLLRAIHIGDHKDGRPFLVTELLMGKNLQDLGQVRWEVACEITRQAAAAIAELHVLGLHHGTLRTSTLFVAAQSAGGSRIKLLDLGTGQRGATAEKDVMALVAILHRLLYGKPPSPPGTPPGPRLVPTGAPPRLDELVRAWWGSQGEGISAAEIASELKFLVDMSTEIPGTKGPRILPKTSLIIIDDEEGSESA